jgi:hypothetical protein
VAEEEQDSLLERLEKTAKVNIYGAVEYFKFGDKDAQFDARHVELLLDLHPTDRLRAFTQIRFERLATIDDDDEFRQGDIEVHQGWMEYAINDYFNPRVGVVLVPFGRYNLESFDHVQELTLRPLMNLRVVPSTWSEPGLGFTGTANLGERLGGLGLRDFALDYQFFLTTGLTNDIRDHRGLRDARGAYEADNNNNKATVGRRGIRPLKGVELGLSSYLGEYDTVGHHINGFDVDGKVTVGPFDLLGEYAVFDLKEGGFRGDTGASPISITTAIVPESLRGGHVEAHYRFWFDFLDKTFLGRKFQDPTFTASARYDQVRLDDDSDAGSGPNVQGRWTVGLNYRPVPTWVLKFDYIIDNQVKTETLDSDRDTHGFIASVAAAF